MQRDDWSQILGALDVGVVVQDTNLRILFANAKATALLGVTADEITARTTHDEKWDVVDEHDQPVRDDGHPGVRALRTGQAVQGVVLGVRRSDRDERAWVLASAIPAFDDAGRVAHVVISVSDVSSAQRALREQETLYQSVFRAMSDGVAIHSADGAVRHANAAAERVLGLSVDQMAGRTGTDPRWKLIKTDGTAATADDVPSEITKRTGEPTTDRVLGVHRPSGEVKWLSVRADPLRDPGDATMRGMVATFTDITREREMLIALERSRTQIQRVLDAVPGVVYQYLRPPEGPDVIPFVAGRIREVLGLDPEAVRAHPEIMFDLVPEPARRALMAQIDHVIRAGEPLDYDVPVGDNRWLRIHGVPNTVSQGVLYTGVISDVTLAHRMAEAMQQRQRRETMGEMAAGVAHNFNNMLAVILPNIELARTCDPADRDRILGDAERAAGSAADLVRRMLVLGRPDAQPSDEAVDAVPLLREALHICRQTFDRTIEIRDRVEASTALVRAPASGLQQVFLNLLMNARDAVTGRDHPRIELTLVPQGDHTVCLQVEDNGIGMSAATLKRIGEPFFTTKPVGQGTGLGLASSFQTVSDSGGNWTVDSAEGRGATFVVCLPVVQPSITGATIPEVAESAPSGGDVLVVDDEPLVLRTLGRQIERLGFDAVLASGGEEALRLLETRGSVRLRAILLDLSMPGLSGTNVLPLLRKLAPRVPVIVLSGHVADPGALDGAARIVQKPVGQKELAAALRAALSEA